MEEDEGLLLPFGVVHVQITRRNWLGRLLLLPHTYTPLRGSSSTSSTTTSIEQQWGLRLEVTSGAVYPRAAAVSHMRTQTVTPLTTDEYDDYESDGEEEEEEDEEVALATSTPLHPSSSSSSLSLSLSLPPSLSSFPFSPPPHSQVEIAWSKAPGVRAGDILVAINGVPVAGKPLHVIEETLLWESECENEDCSKDTIILTLDTTQGWGTSSSARKQHKEQGHGYRWYKCLWRTVLDGFDHLLDVRCAPVRKLGMNALVLILLFPIVESCFQSLNELADKHDLFLLLASIGGREGEGEGGEGGSGVHGNGGGAAPATAAAAATALAFLLQFEFFWSFLYFFTTSLVGMAYLFGPTVEGVSSALPGACAHLLMCLQWVFFVPVGLVLVVLVSTGLTITSSTSGENVMDDDAYINTHTDTKTDEELEAEVRTLTTHLLCVLFVPLFVNVYLRRFAVFCKGYAKVAESKPKALLWMVPLSTLFTGGGGGGGGMRKEVEQHRQFLTLRACGY